MATLLEQSATVNVKVGPFLDETDGRTQETALTITQPDIQLSKNGGTYAQKNAAQTLTHDVDGWYTVALDATDTGTLGLLMLQIHEAGALPVWREFMVLPAAVYNALINATGAGLRADAISWLGTAIVAPVLAGTPDVNTKNAGGTAWASGAIVAAAIATDAITAAKIATGAITSAKFAAGAINAAAIATDAIQAAKIQDGAFTAAKFAAGAFDAVWTVATRLLTAGTNIVLAKGVGLTGLNDIAITAVQTELQKFSVRKNTALANFPFVMYDSAGDPVTGRTVVEERSIDGAAYAACANAFAEVANGSYKLSLAASDLNGDTIIFRFSAAGAQDTFITVATHAT